MRVIRAKRLGLDLTGRRLLAGAADVSGFFAGSDFSWNVQGHLVRRTKALGRDTVLSFGARALHTSYTHNNFTWDATQHGPTFGTSIQF